MASNYPSSVDPIILPTWTWPMGDARRPQSALLTDMRDSIRATQTELGVNPAGAAPTVAERFDAFLARIVALEQGGGGGGGTSGPMVMVWSVPGELSVGLLGMNFPLVGTWTFKGISMTLGTAPGGTAVIVQVLRNGADLYTDANRPRIAVAAREGGALGQPIDGTYTAGNLYADPVRFAISIDQTGGTLNPGKDLVVAMYLQAA